MEEYKTNYEIRKEAQKARNAEQLPSPTGTGSQEFAKGTIETLKVAVLPLRAVGWIAGKIFEGIASTADSSRDYGNHENENRSNVRNRNRRR